METQTVTDSRMQSLIVLFDMHTKFFKSALEGFSGSDAHNRLNTQANHVAWLTGSLVQQRFEIANALGIHKSQKSDSLFKDNQE